MKHQCAECGITMSKPYYLCLECQHDIWKEFIDKLDKREGEIVAHWVRPEDEEPTDWDAELVTLWDSHKQAIGQETWQDKIKKNWRF